MQEVAQEIYPHFRPFLSISTLLIRRILSEIAIKLTFLLKKILEAVETSLKMKLSSEITVTQCSPQIGINADKEILHRRM